MEAFYLIRGNGDDGIPGARKLPAGRQEVELVVQDRQFDSNGQLLFPDGYPSGLDGPLQNPKLHPYWIRSSSATSSRSTARAGRS